MAKHQNEFIWFYFIANAQRTLNENKSVHE